MTYGQGQPESLVIRLYSEIDHIHLSSEAQCVSHLYPQVDCHIFYHEFMKPNTHHLAHELIYSYKERLKFLS